MESYYPTLLSCSYDAASGRSSSGTYSPTSHVPCLGKKTIKPLQDNSIFFTAFRTCPRYSVRQFRHVFEKLSYLFKLRRVERSDPILHFFLGKVSIYFFSIINIFNTVGDHIIHCVSCILLRSSFNISYFTPLNKF